MYYVVVCVDGKWSSVRDGRSGKVCTFDSSLDANRLRRRMIEQNRGSGAIYYVVRGKP
jgi:hypothetical protein